MDGGYGWALFRGRPRTLTRVYPTTPHITLRLVPFVGAVAWPPLARSHHRILPRWTAPRPTPTTPPPTQPHHLRAFIPVPFPLPHVSAPFYLIMVNITRVCPHITRTLPLPVHTTPYPTPSQFFHPHTPTPHSCWIPHTATPTRATTRLPHARATLGLRLNTALAQPPPHMTPILRLIVPATWRALHVAHTCRCRGFAWTAFDILAFIYLRVTRRWMPTHTLHTLLPPAPPPRLRFTEAPLPIAGVTLTAPFAPLVVRWLDFTRPVYHTRLTHLRLRGVNIIH